MKIRGKLESGLAVKTVSITARCRRYRSGEGNGAPRSAPTAREDAIATPVQRTDASRDGYDGKFLDDNFLTMLPGKIVIARQRRR